MKRGHIPFNGKNRRKTGTHPNWDVSRFSGCVPVFTKSASETMQVGRALGRRLKAGDVVALFGDLGTGKTTLTQGIAVSLGVKEAKRVNSPSFVIVKEYKGRLPLYHIDVYRLDKPTRIDLLNLDEYIYGDGVCVIEWADKIEGLLPMRRIEVRLRHKGPTKREIVLRETGTHPNWDVSLSYDNPGF